MKNLKSFLTTVFMTLLALTLYVSNFESGQIAADLIFLLTFGFLVYSYFEDLSESIIFIRTLTFLTLLGILLGIGVKGAISLKNKSVEYQAQSQEIEANRKSYIENLYVVYQEKKDITNLNKETFMEVTKILMEGRKDGLALSWKWTQENQPVPYSEFSDFYRDLSIFIQAYKQECYLFDVKQAQVKKAHSILLRTFPNSAYNVFLGINTDALQN
jgi:hypothetical protein